MIETDDQNLSEDPSAVDSAELEQPLADAAPRRWNAWWIAAAALVFLALWGWREMGMRAERAERDWEAAEINRLQSENDLLRKRIERLHEEVSALMPAELRTVTMAGLPVAPSASARAYVEPSRGRVLLFAQNLPRNRAGTKYRLWLIVPDGSPLSVAEFDVTRSGRATVSAEGAMAIARATQLLVTMEQEGATEPAGEKYLQGDIAATGR